MISINEALFSAVIMSILSGSVEAKVYPDQIVLDQLGDDICRSGYRPLDRYEAEEHRNFLVSNIGIFQVIGLKGDWVITGEFHGGEIRQDPSPREKTFCYPNESNTDIPKYPAHEVPEGNEVDVQYDLVSDREYFIQPLSYLAHYLGYAWVGGNGSQYIGEDMLIDRVGDSWVIQGNDRGSCSGYRCEEKSKITVNNFAYIIDDKSFWHGEVVESERELVKTISATARNYSSVPQQIVVDLKLDESTNWSKTNSYGFAQQVKTENEFQWPLVGNTKLSITLEANQSFSSSNGASTSEQITLQARPLVPANSELPIRVELYRSTISYPYRFNADISYDVNFNGFLRFSGNAWHSHPENRPYKSHTFTVGRGGEKSADIRYQWEHRYIASEVNWWDWSWAIKEFGLSSMQDATGGSLRPFYSYVSGDFYAESQYAGTIEIGNATPLSIQSRSLKEASQGIGDIKVSSNFDADELRLLGFDGAEMTIRAVTLQ